VDFFSRQIQPRQRAADGAWMCRLANRLDHFGQCCIRLVLDQLSYLPLVVVVVGALVVMTRRRQRFKRTAFTTLLDQLSHPGFAAVVLLRRFK